MKEKRGHIIALKFMFFIYVLFTLYFLFFAESMGRTGVREGYRYNIIPFKEIKRYIKWATVSEYGMKTMILNIFGNIICFVPLGFFIPAVSKNIKKCIYVLLICAISSTVVEIIQLITMTGSCDVDDIFLNTAGGIIGYICYAIAVRIKKYNKSLKNN